METPRTSQPLADDSQFRMIDVGEKAITRRRAVAQGRISMAAETLRRIRDRQMPKGDVLAMAEVAGIMAAKRTPDILPLCHPLLLDAIRVKCEIEEKTDSVLVTCDVITHSKTGVEMEALTGVSAALLSIYDLTKIIDPVLTISDVYLRTKEGGKSGIWSRPGLAQSKEEAPLPPALAGIKAAVITISDRCSKGQAEDRSGPTLVQILRNQGAVTAGSVVVPDEINRIQTEVRRLIENEKAELVITTGGTGLGPRDVTPEALAPLFTKVIPGIGELLRSRGAAHTEMSWLSRSEGGLVGNALVILLPGSPKAVSEGMAELEDLLLHAIRIARGGSH